MKYTQLKESERVVIEVLLEEGKSMRVISKRLGRNVGTVSREIQRNRNQNSGEYLAVKAHTKAVKRLKYQRYKAPLKNPKVFLYVREKLRELWTPEEIAGRLVIDHPEESIHHETIYRYIYNSKKTRGMKLWRYLKYHRKKRMRKYGRKVQSTKIKDIKRIDNRDKSILLRTNIGHWETDNMGGKTQDNSAFCGTVERKTRYTILDVLENRKATTKTKSLVTDLSMFPKIFVQTITTDNGSENSDHKNWTKQIRAQVYFCNPYHSWEKGSIENVFTRVRRFIPKGTSIDTISKQQAKAIQNKLNNTPRKCLNYQTPNEAMMLELQQFNKH
ncbi:MAG: IS30 family transposase [Pseudomonadales bacterium]|nr:IS30 family transposase [Pseudomonadales bacterium]